MEILDRLFGHSDFFWRMNLIWIYFEDTSAKGESVYI